MAVRRKEGFLKFLYRLALALLAEWFCDRISTPEMRYRAARLRMVRRIARAMKGAIPVVNQLNERVTRMAKSMRELLESFEEASRPSGERVGE